MADELTLIHRTLDLLHDDDDSPPGGDRAPEPTISILIGDASGQTIAVDLRASEVDGLAAGRLVELAIDRAEDDLDGTPLELAHRSQFLAALRRQLADARGNAPGHILMMRDGADDDPEAETRQVHPGAPLELGDDLAEDLSLHFSICPYHVGGEPRP
jgi:hypothetical protein